MHIGGFFGLFALMFKEERSLTGMASKLFNNCCEKDTRTIRRDSSHSAIPVPGSTP
jgi:hypothetical protein